MPRDIQERTFAFALSVINMCRHARRGAEDSAIIEQVMRSAGSVGANVEEASAGYTRADFAYIMNIALREARETHYWLRLMRDAGLVGEDDIVKLITEAEELKKILGAIVSRSRGVQQRSR